MLPICASIHSSSSLVTSCFVFVLQVSLLSSCRPRPGKQDAMSPEIKLYYTGPVLSRYTVVGSVTWADGLLPFSLFCHLWLGHSCLFGCKTVNSAEEYSQSMCMLKSQYQPSRQYSTLGEGKRHLLPLLCHGLSTLRILHSLFIALLPMVECTKDILLLNCKVQGP